MMKSLNYKALVVDRLSHWNVKMHQINWNYFHIKYVPVDIPERRLQSFEERTLVSFFCVWLIWIWELNTTVTPIVSTATVQHTRYWWAARPFTTGCRRELLWAVTKPTSHPWKRIGNGIASLCSLFVLGFWVSLWRWIIAVICVAFSYWCVPYTSLWLCGRSKISFKFRSWCRLTRITDWILWCDTI